MKSESGIETITGAIFMNKNKLENQSCSSFADCTANSPIFEEMVFCDTLGAA